MIGLTKVWMLYIDPNNILPIGCQRRRSELRSAKVLKVEEKVKSMHHEMGTMSMVGGTGERNSSFAPGLRQCDASPDPARRLNE